MIPIGSSCFKTANLLNTHTHHLTWVNFTMLTQTTTTHIFVCSFYMLEILENNIESFG